MGYRLQGEPISIKAGMPESIDLDAAYKLIFEEQNKISTIKDSF